MEPGEASEKEPSTGDVNRTLTEFGMFVLRGAVLLWPVYVCGALGLSMSWLLFSVLLWGLWQKNRRRKDQRVNTAIHLVENEGEVIQKEMKETLNSPAWVGTSENDVSIRSVYRDLISYCYRNIESLVIY